MRARGHPVLRAAPCNTSRQPSPRPPDDRQRSCARDSTRRGLASHARRGRGCGPQPFAAAPQPPAEVGLRSGRFSRARWRKRRIRGAGLTPGRAFPISRKTESPFTRARVVAAKALVGLSAPSSVAGLVHFGSLRARENPRPAQARRRPRQREQVKVNAGKIDTTGLEWKPNPFDEYAVETALRLTENGANTEGPPRRGRRRHLRAEGGGDDAARRAGDRRRPRHPRRRDRRRSSTATSSRAPSRRSSRRRSRTSCSLGKQQVDGDSNQVGQILAEYLGWPQATFAGSIKSEDDKALVVGREVDGGTAQARGHPPRGRQRSTSASSRRTSVYVEALRRRTTTRTASASPRSWRSWPRRRSRSPR